jgi:hypothetical protein
VFAHFLAGDILTTYSALLRRHVQQWGLLRLLRLHKGRPSATTSDGSVSQLLTADSLLSTDLTSVRVSVTSRLAVYRQSFRLGANPLETHDLYLLFITEHLQLYSLTRGWVCCLQLLLAITSAVILGSESRGYHNHILLSQIRDAPNLEGKVPVFISPRNRADQLNP